jgi:hypothetical protein
MYQLAYLAGIIAFRDRFSFTSGDQYYKPGSGTCRNTGIQSYHPSVLYQEDGGTE